ncbi:hypothetical protein LPJ78_000932 [Coemansia sp. RSA 989]|nr:hypothetical protein LPJ68_000753 [Coemansia sp. RSA 1086]KAJ1752874.1 hypothetical protein LPJ79_000861 [Coemansia sp. RSA 1821]KAJ1867522.1 hypothetical protein LPJ78_000932 [Coemansia sp. RSA 989]KAJ1875780.1 hypothetical protein LPJ55_000406 [Coemansia sp. RSA 990]
MQTSVITKFGQQETYVSLHSRRDSLGQYMSSSPEPESLSSGGRSSSSPGRSACTCEVCGKRYKHRSCLHKHLWEHHDAWETCLKYNLTKHQQVQMMEAAQVLVDMMGIKSQ